MRFIKKMLPSPLCTFCTVIGIISIMNSGELGKVLIQKNDQGSYVADFSVNFFMGAFSPFIVVLDIGGIMSFIAAFTVFIFPFISIFLIKKDGNFKESIFILVFPAVTASLLTTNTYTNIASGIGGVMSPIVLAVFLFFVFLGQAKKGLKDELGISSKKS